MAEVVEVHVPIGMTDELLLAIQVEKRAYSLYVKEPIGPHKRAWTEATIDLRFKGGSPIKKKEIIDYLVGMKSKRLSPDSPIDREARRVVDSLVQGQRRRLAPPRPKGVGMATENLVIVVEEGACGCGCGTPVKRTYAQGHDARLRGMLVKAYRADQKVSVTNPDGKTKVHTAEALLKEHNFPIPEKKAPKAKAAKKSNVTKIKPRTASADDEGENEGAEEPEGATV